MDKSSFGTYLMLILSILSGLISFTNCKKTDNPVKYPLGTFPDTVINLSDINSPYDDYNIALNQITVNSPIIFSSNRKSSGGQFDLEQALLTFAFDKSNGSFTLDAGMSEDAFLNKLINKAKTAGNDFGPFRFFNPSDGFEYLVLSSANPGGNLDLYYLKNRPASNSVLPDIDGPFPVTLLNTGSDEAYFCFDTNLDSAYFSSNYGGNFDIYLQKRPVGKDLTSWFNTGYAISSGADSINSGSDDKCPYVFKKIMVFTSNRPGGFGGYDLYYSIFRKGKWSSPVNFGPRINTSSDEYRPVIGFYPDFANYFMMFSSNRQGGKGGFDLYFSGIEFPE
jgi:hypothetical protein